MIGTYDGNIYGRVDGNLEMAGSVIQSATGNIELSVGGDLLLKSSDGFAGAIRTTGRARFEGAPPENEDQMAPEDYLSLFWNYADGGDIRIAVRGAVAGALSQHRAWDAGYRLDPHFFWGASYGCVGLGGSFPTEGIATMAGGSITIRAGGDFKGQLGAFGTGDLNLSSGGNVDGRFLVRNGKADLQAAGNFGRGIPDAAIEIFDSRFSLAALGDIYLGTALNPTVAGPEFLDGWYLNYSEDASLRLWSVQGDIMLSGRSRYYPEDTSRQRILPPSVEIAAGRDIRLSNLFALTPSTHGSMRLVAGRDINGEYASGAGATLQVSRSSINMSDADPKALFGDHTGEVNSNGVLIQHDAMIFNPYEHALNPLHKPSGTQVAVSAGRDLKNLSLALPMQADITAAGDIRDFYFLGQNLNASDVTRIRAERDILFQTFANSFKGGVEWGGPGFLSIQAANSIDLGNSQGIQSVGNQYNTALGVKGCNVGLVVGYDVDLSESQIQQFFSSIRELGTEYSNLLASGDRKSVFEKIEQIRKEVIQSTLGATASGTGNIEMISSQINNSGGPDNLSLIAAGPINVGRSTFLTDENTLRRTGIFTAAGGEINLFSQTDINVNESRVMTFRGGNITAYTDSGNINAGRGSKAAISTEPPKKVPFQDTFIIVFEPPAVGSGIRTLTYDPDGFEGPLKEPLAGDLFLFAPKGIIDAGEAGIVGRNVILGATQVLNAQNISFAVGSVGVPQTGPAGPSIGALAGAGSVSETTKIAQESSTVKGAEERLAKFTEEMNKNLVPKMVMVEVLGFEEEEKKQ